MTKRNIMLYIFAYFLNALYLCIKYHSGLSMINLICSVFVPAFWISYVPCVSMGKLYHSTALSFCVCICVFCSLMWRIFRGTSFLATGSPGVDQGWPRSGTVQGSSSPLTTSHLPWSMTSCFDTSHTTINKRYNFTFY